MTRSNKYKGPRVRMTIRLPMVLDAALTHAAKDAGISVNDYIVVHLERAVANAEMASSLPDDGYKHEREAFGNTFRKTLHRD